MAQRQQHHNLKQTRDFVAIYEICFTLSTPMSDRCVLLKPDSALKHLLWKRFPQWGQWFAHQPMLIGRLCQLILLSLWKARNAIARHSENERDTNSLGYYYRMMDTIGAKYRHLGLLNLHHDPEMSQALGLVTRYLTMGELLARLVPHTLDQVHQPALYPGMGPMRPGEVLGHQSSSQVVEEATAAPWSSPHLHVLLPFIYFGTFTSLSHGMQDRLYTIRSGSAYLKMIREYDLSLPADDPRRKELPGWPGTPCRFSTLLTYLGLVLNKIHFESISRGTNAWYLFTGPFSDVFNGRHWVHLNDVPEAIAHNFAPVLGVTLYGIREKQRLYQGVWQLELPTNLGWTTHVMQQQQQQQQQLQKHQDPEGHHAQKRGATHVLLKADEDDEGESQPKRRVGNGPFL